MIFFGNYMQCNEDFFKKAIERPRMRFGEKEQSIATDTDKKEEKEMKNKEKQYTEEELLKKAINVTFNPDFRITKQQEKPKEPAEVEKKYVEILEDGSMCEFNFSIKAEKVEGNIEEILHKFAQNSRPAYISLGNKMIWELINKLKSVKQ